MPPVIYREAFLKLIEERATEKDGRRILPINIREMRDLLEKATGHKPSVSNVFYMLHMAGWEKQASWTKEIKP